MVTVIWLQGYVIFAVYYILYILYISTYTYTYTYIYYVYFVYVSVYVYVYVYAYAYAYANTYAYVLYMYTSLHVSTYYMHLWLYGICWVVPLSTEYTSPGQDQHNFGTAPILDKAYCNVRSQISN